MSQLIKSFLDVQAYRQAQMAKEAQVMFEHQPFIEAFEKTLADFKAEQQVYNSHFFYCAPDNDYWFDVEHIWLQALQFLADTPYKLQLMVQHVPDYTAASAFCEFSHKHLAGRFPLYWRTERTPNYLTFIGHVTDWPQLSIHIQLSASTFCVGKEVTKTVIEYQCSEMD